MVRTSAAEAADARRTPTASASLAQAIAVPGPPTNEMLPAISPTKGCAPRPRHHQSREVLHDEEEHGDSAQDRGGLPPARRAESLAERPMVTKKTSRRMSRKVVAKVMSTPPAKYATDVTRDITTPPTTGGGMSSRASAGMWRHSAMPTCRATRPSRSV